MPPARTPGRLSVRLAGLLLAVCALITVLAGDAHANARLKRACRQLCQPYRELCVATDRRGRRRLYKLCWKNLQQSCRLSSTQTFPPTPTCTFPCGTDADCSFGRHCVQLQCIIPPVFSRGGKEDPGDAQCTDAAFPVACDSGACCPAGNLCNPVDPSYCCPADFPVGCIQNCCPQGATCRSDSRCCKPGYPVDCPNVCCAAGSSCGPNDTCIPGGSGGTDCSCRCDDNSVCTSNADCGVDSYGIPNVCGCPVSPPCDGHGNGG